MMNGMRSPHPPRGVEASALAAVRLATLAQLAACMTAAAAAQAPARTPDIHYTPTRHAVATAMLALAEVGPDDVVFDLGSGDGRLPIIAAQTRGARGVGIEIDPGLVALARQNARDAGVADRVTFLEGDLLTADLSGATVVTLYLSTSLMRRLEETLPARLAHGVRIVSHQFRFPRWNPEQSRRVDSSDLFLWRTPRR